MNKWSLGIVISAMLFCTLKTYSQCSMTLDSIQNIYRSLYWNDLQNRKLLIQNRKNDYLIDSLNAVVIKKDQENALLVIKIASQCGWKSLKELGIDAYNGQCLPIQHSNLESMEKIFPIITKPKSKIEKRYIAKLEDRYFSIKYGFQYYGTQYFFNQQNLRFEFFQILDIENLKKRRKKRYLGKIKDFANRNKIYFPKNFFSYYRFPA